MGEPERERHARVREGLPVEAVLEPGRVAGVAAAQPELLPVILAGALIGISSSFFYRVEDARLHAIQAVLLAAFIGLVIFMTIALDRPFCGDLGVGHEPYQLVYEHPMKP